MSKGFWYWFKRQITFWVIVFLFGGMLTISGSFALLSYYNIHFIFSIIPFILGILMMAYGFYLMEK